ncbi:hypothetical protein SLS62_002330 [Diatrype stigma]|uniref:Uncharacterized protein n=1 Tax=Diatrype stigma TaxID=117547 RepID=A0AAN9YR01_9PEZI
MKFAAVAALATLASGASLQKKQSTEIQIGAFTASCVPHSVMCNYAFEVTSDPSLSPSHCSAFVQGPDSLPAVANGACPDNVAYTWSIDKVEAGGLNFKISFPFNARSNITYCHSIAADELTVDDNGSVQDQRYTGPANFTASTSVC